MLKHSILIFILICLIFIFLIKFFIFLIIKTNNTKEIVHVQNYKQSTDLKDKLIDKYLAVAEKMQGNGLIIKQGSAPIVKTISGNKNMEVPAFVDVEVEMILLSILSEEQKQELNKYNKVTFKYNNNYFRYNVTITKHDNDYTGEFDIIN